MSEIQDPTDPDLGNVHSPYLFIPLYKGDSGELAGRYGHPNILARTPFGVDLSLTLALVTAINGGYVASDLVMLEYQVVYCTASAHGASDGFTSTVHAGEFAPSPVEKYDTLDFIPPRSPHTWRVKLPEVIGEQDLVNIYFRARVSTLWTGKEPLDRWSFENDPAVAEAHYRRR